MKEPHNKQHDTRTAPFQDLETERAWQMRQGEEGHELPPGRVVSNEHTVSINRGVPFDGRSHSKSSILLGVYIRATNLENSYLLLVGRPFYLLLLWVFYTFSILVELKRSFKQPLHTATEYTGAPNSPKEVLFTYFRPQSKYALHTWSPGDMEENSIGSTSLPFCA